MSCGAREGRLFLRELLGELDEGLRRPRAVAVLVPGETERGWGDPRAEGEHLHPAVARIHDEPRLDRGAEILCDESAERAVVVGAEDDIQLGDATGGEPLGAETSSTYGSCNTSAHSNGPSRSGRSANVRSSSPCSRRRKISAAELSSRTRTPPWRHWPRKRRTRAGRSRAPTLW